MTSTAHAPQAPETGAEGRKIRTRIPARLDRLAWSAFHRRVVIGLGTVWILDGIEVTIVGSIASRLTEKDSGLGLTASQVGSSAAFYVAGACIGALLFGQLTDRFGRKKLFIVTLGVYIAATAATAFAFSPLYFFIARFVTGMGIGGEYAAINSAIDELIPARVRGQTDLMINGSYWLGSAAGSALALVLLDTSIFPADIGWRLAFGMGVVLGFAIMIVRRKVPESPRWLFIHGREDEAERIVTDIEREAESDGAHLEEPGGEIEIRQRERIPFRTIASVAFTKYPKRATLGIALFVGQAFLYNGVTFNLGTLFTTFYGVSSSTVPIFIIAFALGNFAGPLTLGRLFDTVGRKPMITITYVGSAVLTVLLAVLFANGALSKWSFEGLIVLTFFFASAGASAAYLTVSEIFPMETRALAIAFFYAVGTAIGGITGPLLFGELIGSGDRGQVAIAFYIGAAAMAIGGIAELFLGVRAEGQSLEDIARPLTATDQDEASEPGDEQPSGPDQVDDAARARREQAAERERRSRERLARHAEFERHGRRRYRPGGGATIGSRGFGRFPVTPGPDYDLDREVEIIGRTLEERGPLRRSALAEAVGARFWGPGRFRRALRFATEEGAARQVSSDTFEAGGDRDQAGVGEARGRT
jgi:MFS family permease